VLMSESYMLRVDMLLCGLPLCLYSEREAWEMTKTRGESKVANPNLTVVMKGPQCGSQLEF
jgi:hypothetical protein